MGSGMSIDLFTAFVCFTDRADFNGVKTIADAGNHPIKIGEAAARATEQPRKIRCCTREEAAARNGHV